MVPSIPIGDTMLSTQMIEEIVEELAQGNFVNGEAFSPSEIKQINKVWKEHPKHPSNAEVS